MSLGGRISSLQQLKKYEVTRMAAGGCGGGWVERSARTLEAVQRQSPPAYTGGLLRHVKGNINSACLCCCWCWLAACRCSLACWTCHRRAGWQSIGSCTPDPDERFGSCIARHQPLKRQPVIAKSLQIKFSKFSPLLAVTRLPIRAGFGRVVSAAISPIEQAR